MAMQKLNKDPFKRRVRRFEEEPYGDPKANAKARIGYGRRGETGEGYYSANSSGASSYEDDYASANGTGSTGGSGSGSSGGYASNASASGNANASAGASSNSGTGTNGTNSTGSGTDYSALYNGLANKLRSYGIANIPAYSELYGLFESFLRPAIEAAISAREQRGRTNAAEIDADAYARGMGGSSYVSSMKMREKDSAAADIAALEGKYTASMAEYIYKAVSAMQQMEADLAKTRMTLAAQKQMNDARVAATYASIAARNAAGESGSSGSGKSGKSGKSSSGKGKKSGKKSGSSSSNAAQTGSKYGHNKNGAYFDGKWYEGDFSYLKKKYSYSDYAKYLSSLSQGDRYLFFNSDSREWRIRRWQVQYNLAEVDYLDLVSEYRPGTPGGSTNHGGYNGSAAGGAVWRAMPY